MTHTVDSIRRSMAREALTARRAGLPHPHERIDRLRRLAQPPAAPATSPNQPLDDTSHALFAAYLDALVRTKEAADPQEYEAASREADRLWAMLKGDHADEEGPTATLAADPFAPPKPKQWAEYRGPRGGRGWHNPETGQVRYNTRDPNLPRGRRADDPDAHYRDWLVPGEELTPDLRAEIDRHRAAAGLIPPADAKVETYSEATHGRSPQGHQGYADVGGRKLPVAAMAPPEQPKPRAPTGDPFADYQAGTNARPNAAPQAPSAPPPAPKPADPRHNPDLDDAFGMEPAPARPAAPQPAPRPPAPPAAPAKPQPARFHVPSGGGEPVPHVPQQQQQAAPQPAPAAPQGLYRSRTPARIHHPGEHVREGIAPRAPMLPAPAPAARPAPGTPENPVELEPADMQPNRPQPAPQPLKQPLKPPAAPSPAPASTPAPATTSPVAVPAPQPLKPPTDTDRQPPTTAPADPHAELAELGHHLERSEAGHMVPGLTDRIARLANRHNLTDRELVHKAREAHRAAQGPPTPHPNDALRSGAGRSDRRFGHAHLLARREAKEAGHDVDALQQAADDLQRRHNAEAERHNELLRFARQFARSNGYDLTRRGNDKLVGGREDDNRGLDEVTDEAVRRFPAHFRPETGEHGGHDDQLRAMLQEGDRPLMSAEEAFRKAMEQAEEEAYRRRLAEESGEDDDRPRKPRTPDDDFIPFGTDAELFAVLSSLPESVTTFTHRGEAWERIPAVEWDALLNNDGWEPYRGPRGGVGWRNLATGRIVYTASPTAPGYARRQVQASQKRALELSGRHAAALRGTGEPHLSEAELRELADHVQALPVHTLRSLKNHIMGTWGNVRRRAQMVEALQGHVRRLVDEHQAMEADYHRRNAGHPTDDMLPHQKREYWASVDQQDGNTPSLARDRLMAWQQEQAAGGYGRGTGAAPKAAEPTPEVEPQAPETPPEPAKPTAQPGLFDDGPEETPAHPMPFPVKADAPFEKKSTVGQTGPVEDVPTKSLVATQPTLDPKYMDELHAGGKPKTEGPPKVVRIGDEHHIDDGHHRAAHQAQTGAESIKAEVFEHDPQTKKTKPLGYTPVPEAVSDDEYERMGEEARQKAQAGLGKMAEKQREREERRAEARKATEPAKPVYPAAHEVDPATFVKESEFEKKRRAAYFDEQGNRKASSRETPNEFEHPPLGSWKIDDTFEGNYGRELEQLREMDPHSLVLSEGDYYGTKDNTEGRGWDAEKYADWMREGKQAPPISVVEMEDGRHKVIDGHRRVAAAKKAGLPIRAWVSPKADTGKKDSEGKPIYTGLTDRLAGVKQPEAAKPAEDTTPDPLSLAARHRHGGVIDRAEAEQLHAAYAGLSDKDRTHFAEAFGIENAARSLPEVRDELVGRKVREMAHRGEHGPEVKKGGSLFGERGVGESRGLFDQPAEEPAEEPKPAPKPQEPAREQDAPGRAPAAAPEEPKAEAKPEAAPVTGPSAAVESVARTYHGAATATAEEVAAARTAIAGMTGKDRKALAAAMGFPHVSKADELADLIEDRHGAAVRRRLIDRPAGAKRPEPDEPDDPFAHLSPAVAKAAGKHGIGATAAGEAARVAKATGRDPDELIAAAVARRKAQTFERAGMGGRGSVTRNYSAADVTPDDIRAAGKEAKPAPVTPDPEALGRQLAAAHARRMSDDPTAGREADDDYRKAREQVDALPADQRARALAAAEPKAPEPPPAGLRVAKTNERHHSSGAVTKTHFLSDDRHTVTEQGGRFHLHEQAGGRLTHKGEFGSLGEAVAGAGGKPAETRESPAHVSPSLPEKAEEPKSDAPLGGSPKAAELPPHEADAAHEQASESAPAPPADETPRQAAKRSAKAGDDQYAFARKSDVPNAGEDLLGSARHKAGWRGLAEAERDGTADELVTRDKLLKAEPIGLHSAVEKGHALTALTAHLTMAKFPPKPDLKGFVPRSATPEQKAEIERKARQLYYDEFRAVKEGIEQIAHDEPDPMRATARMRKLLTDRIAGIRGYRDDGDRFGREYMLGGKKFHDDPDFPSKAPVSNGLIEMRNKLATHRPGKLDVHGQLADFANRVKEKYGADPAAVVREHGDALARHVMDVLEGDSFNSTFGTKGEAKGRLSPAEMYLGKAKRTGGRVIDASTVKAGTDYMMGTVGLRGLQYGNYVTDDERQHHLQKAAEAFADLADVLGLPDDAISLGGKLGLAIGARGKGVALAHYEPDRKVINLTRGKGAGSLAHEWGHFFDHELAGGGKVTHTGGGPTTGAFIAGFQSNDRPQKGKPPASDLAAAYHDWHAALDSSGYRKRLGQVVREFRQKGMMTDATSLYWLSEPEVFARTFERHVQEKLHAAGRENTYLTGFDKDKQEAGNLGHLLWPTADEAKVMGPAFDKIVAAYKAGRK